MYKFTLLLYCPLSLLKLNLSLFLSFPVHITYHQYPASLYNSHGLLLLFYFWCLLQIKANRMKMRFLQYCTLSRTHRSSGQKIKRETSELNDITHQMDLTDMCRIFYPSTKEYTFYSIPQVLFNKIEQILGYKTISTKMK